MSRLEETRALREDSKVHYNCCQAVVMSYAQDCGISQKTAAQLSAHFGAGMRCGATCGAVTGGLMVLGLLGKGEEEARRLMDAFRQKNSCLDCTGLLQKAAGAGEARKPHCDRMVYEVVALVEAILC